MALTAEERKDKLDRILDLLQTSRYTYSKARGAISLDQLPPPVGSSLNCESAARVFVQIAHDMGVDKLEGIYYAATRKNTKGDNLGYLVPIPAHVKALGNPPEINKGGFTAWEFDNHWRVRDTVTGVIYDPTFGTSSPNNLLGIIGTEMTTGKNFAMTTVYGGRYSIERAGINVIYKELNKSPIKSVDQVTDLSFTMKPLVNMRLTV